MIINFEDQRSNKILKNLIFREISKLILLYQDVKSLNYFYSRKVTSKWKKYIGTKDAYLVDSGTTALILALKLLEVGKEDEVILPIGIYPAAALAVYSVGAKMVFVDVKRDGTIDETKIEKKITKNTKVILPVHMYGVPSEMNTIKKISQKYNLKILEDVCQAHGSLYKGKKLGTFGDVSVFSFNPHKTISTLGNGGAINFNQKQFREKIYQLIQYEKDNPKLLQAKRSASSMSYLDMAFLKCKLDAVSLIEKSKKEAKYLYEKHLSLLSPFVEIIKDNPKRKIMWQFYLIYAKNRDNLFNYLKKQGVICRMPYPPLYKFKMFNKWTKGQKFPQAEKNFKEGICLPCFPFIKKEEVLYICQKIKDFYSN